MQSRLGPAGGRPPRLAAAAGRGRQVPPEGGPRPRPGRPPRLQAGAARRADVHLPALRRPPGRPAPRHRRPRRRHLLRPGRVVDLGHRHAHGRLGVGQQVLAHGRPAGRRPAHRLRAADGARRRRRGHPGRHAQPAAASWTAQANGSIFGFGGLGNPFILTQFVGFVIFLIAVQAELTQTPVRHAGRRVRARRRLPASTPASGSCSSSSASSPPPSPSPPSPPPCSSAAGPCPASAPAATPTERPRAARPVRQDDDRRVPHLLGPLHLPPLP